MAGQDHVTLDGVPVLNKNENERKRRVEERVWWGPKFQVD